MLPRYLRSIFIVALVLSYPSVATEPWKSGDPVVGITLHEVYSDPSLSSSWLRDVPATVGEKSSGFTLTSRAGLEQVLKKLGSEFDDFVLSMSVRFSLIEKADPAVFLSMMAFGTSLSLEERTRTFRDLLMEGVNRRSFRVDDLWTIYYRALDTVRTIRERMFTAQMSDSMAQTVAEITNVRVEFTPPVGEVNLEGLVKVGESFSGFPQMMEVLKQVKERIKEMQDLRMKVYVYFHDLPESRLKVADNLELIEHAIDKFQTDQDLAHRLALAILQTWKSVWTSTLAVEIKRSYLIRLQQIVYHKDGTLKEVAVGIHKLLEQIRSEHTGIVENLPSSLECESILKAIDMNASILLTTSAERNDSVDTGNLAMVERYKASLDSFGDKLSEFVFRLSEALLVAPRIFFSFILRLRSITDRLPPVNERMKKCQVLLEAERESAMKSKSPAIERFFFRAYSDISKLHKQYWQALINWRFVKLLNDKAPEFYRQKKYQIIINLKKDATKHDIDDLKRLFEKGGLNVQPEITKIGEDWHSLQSLDEEGRLLKEVQEQRQQLINQSVDLSATPINPEEESLGTVRQSLRKLCVNRKLSPSDPLCSLRDKLSDYLHYRYDLAKSPELPSDSDVVDRMVELVGNTDDDATPPNVKEFADIIMQLWELLWNSDVTDAYGLDEKSSYELLRLVQVRRPFSARLDELIGSLSQEPAWFKGPVPSGLLERLKLLRTKIPRTWFPDVAIFRYN